MARTRKGGGHSRTGNQNPVAGSGSVRSSQDGGSHLSIKGPSAADDGLNKKPLLSNRWHLGFGFLSFAVIVGLVAVLLYARFNRDGLAVPDVITPHPAPTVKSLPQFEERRDAMMWGTYRPHTYLGFRARVPKSIIAGLAWVGMTGPIRYMCDQGDGVKYMWQKHDGETVGVQRIQDGDIILDTSFVKNVFDGDVGDFGGDWATHISVQWKTSVFQNSNEKPSIPIFFYFYNEGPERFNFEEDGRILVGSNSFLGKFRARFIIDAPEDSLYSFTAIPVDGIEKLTQNLTAVLLSKDFRWNRAYDNGQAYIIQLTAKPPYDLHVVYESQSPGDGAFDLSVRHERLYGQNYFNLLNQQLAAFDEKFERIFHLKQKKFSEEEIVFAKSALSNMLGSIGYWYGSSLVRDVAEERRLEALAQEQRKHRPGTKQYSSPPPIIYKSFEAPLYSGVPSRSFFPRGFMWDEGFHQLLINQWSPDITRDVLAHWLDLMNVHGWIPREQILGPEARAKVPEEFVVQPSDNANPPAWFLVLGSILDRIDEANDDTHPMIARDIEFIKASFVRFSAWFKWFDSQRGVLSGSYRWRGRIRKLNQMNPLTLTSGLDDYPRATHPDDSERHLDLRCWMADAATVLARAAARANIPDAEYRYLSQKLKNNAALNILHWSNETHSYHDYGRHRMEPNRKPKRRFVRDVFGYVSLFPLLLRQLDPYSPQLGNVLEDLENPRLLWTKYGLRSLAPTSPYYQAHNTNHDPPYWRGAIWININFLAVRSLRFYGATPGPYQEHADKLYVKLRSSLITNIFQQYKRTGFIWEQYDDRTGSGKGSHPFTGWSALVVLLMAEVY